MFDFRAGVVHLKSTDTKLKDKGNELRKRAAQALGKWITKDRKARGERDYVVMGDMNAETSKQGLAPFTQGDLALLSVGMKEEYGSDQALTRVASKRLLDHIVVTTESLALAPPEDLDEQIIIRADLKIDGFTEEYSDHVPVAVRFVLAKDRD